MAKNSQYFAQVLFDNSHSSHARSPSRTLFTLGSSFFGGWKHISAKTMHLSLLSGFCDSSPKINNNRSDISGTYRPTGDFSIRSHTPNPYYKLYFIKETYGPVA